MILSKLLTYKLSLMDKKNNNLSIKEVLCPELIRVKVEANDRDEAIRVAGKMLVDENIVEEKYIKAMINTCNELGPYIVLAPHVAIPHARPEDGVNQVGLSLVTLQEPICFGNVENDPVKIVIAFASPDNNKHVELLSELANFLQSPELINRVIRAKSDKEIISLVCGDGTNS